MHILTEESRCQDSSTVHELSGEQTLTEVSVPPRKIMLDCTGRLLEHHAIHLWISERMIRRQKKYTMNRKLTQVAITALSALLLFSCAHSETLIIDGDVAREMENRIHLGTIDPYSDRRGNTLSNIRNGGELLLEGESLHIVQQMVFDDETTLHYLQSLPVEHLDNYYTHYSFIAEVNGAMVASKEDAIYILDSTGYPSVLHLDTFVTEPITDRKATSFQFFDGIGYYSDLDGNVYQIDPVSLSEQQLLFEAGRLLSIDEQRIYTIREQGSSDSIDIYDTKELKRISRVTGGPFTDPQISGSYLFYRSGGNVLRASLNDPEIRDKASVLRADEYAIHGECMVIAAEGGGLYASKLDGTCIRRLSMDRASSLHMAEDLVFYRNGFDMDTWYAIRLSTGHRFAVCGETMTDGGIHFTELDQNESVTAQSFFGGFLSTLQPGNPFPGNTPAIEPGLPLFVDLREEKLEFYAFHDTYSLPQDVDLIITITNREEAVGRYTDNTLAYRTDTVLSLYSLTSPRPILTLTQPGLPPIELKHGGGDRYGVPASWHPKALEIINLVQGPGA